MGSCRVVIEGLFIFLIVKVVRTCGEGCIRIGVIANGIDSVSTEWIPKCEKNVSLLWHSVDTSEIYNIFRSIKVLDAEEDVDVITLFDYDPLILRMPDLLKTTNKTLIKWGERTHHTHQNADKSSHYIDPGDICGTEDLPDLTFDDPYCIHDHNSTLEQGNDKLITLLGPQALTVLVKTLSWKAVFIFYETSTETETSDLVDFLSRESVLLSLFNIDDVHDIHSLLQKIYLATIPHNKDINIIVLCRFMCTRKILRMANTFDPANRQHKTLLKTFSRWLIAVYGYSQGVSRGLQACAKELDNVAVVAFPEFNGNGTKAFHEALDSILLDILKIRIQGGDRGYKREIIDRLEIKAATWSPICKCLAYNIDTLLHTTTGRRFNSVGYIGIDGAVVVHPDIFPNTNYGYNMRHFKVATLSYSRFVMKKEVNGSVIYEGFCIDLLDELARKLNFTYTLSEPADGAWRIYKDINNLTFNGLIGELQREEVDIVVGPVAVTSERNEVVDFSHPFFYEYASVIIKKPDVNATKWRTLIDPFKWEVLVSIGISLPTITILAFLSEKYNPFYGTPKQSEERKSNGGIHNWHSSFWYMYGALLCQGGVHLPDSVAGRTLVSFWWMFCIVIVGIYSGNLIAFLTVTKEKPPFNTLSEMTKLKGSYTWGILSGTNMETTFLKSNNPTYRAVGAGIRDFNRSDPDVLNTDPDVHIRKVKEGKYAWIGDKTYIEISMATECSLMTIKEKFLPMKYGLGFVKNSPHTAVFSKKIIKLNEGGLFQIWKRKWWPKANFCDGTTLTGAKPISLMDVQSAFYVCFVGVFLGLFAFTLEIIVHKCRERKRARMQQNKNGQLQTNGDIGSESFCPKEM